MTNSNQRAAVPEFHCFMEPAKIERIATVLQAGFYVRSKTGITLFSFLQKLPGFSNDYIIDRLQTIFLDGDAIDDLQNTFTESSATLALSAAMPGLAGAIYRKQSPHASLRKSPVIRKTSQAINDVLVRVKFFNVIAIEKGPAVLEQGAVINTKDISSFMQLRPSLIESMQDLTCNKQPLNPHEFLSTVATYKQITLICKASNG